MPAISSSTPRSATTASLATDLDFLLRSHGINTLLITGVNTNSCVLATTTAANVRDYAVIVVEDCVDSMDGPELHAAGLACIRTAFGSVMNTDEVMALEGLAPASSYRRMMVLFS